MAVNGLGRPSIQPLTTRAIDTNAPTGRGAATTTAPGAQDTFAAAQGSNPIADATKAIDEMTTIPTARGDIDAAQALGADEFSKLKTDFKNQLQQLQGLPPEEQKKKAAEITKEFQFQCEFRQNQLEQGSAFLQQMTEKAKQAMIDAMKDS